MPEDTPKPEIQRRARRVLWSAGLCLGLLFLMGLSGVASITLLYDDPMMRTNMRGFEGDVLQIVSSIKGPIHFLHEWGGYAGIVLAGWAGLEAFAFARLLRRSDKPEWRAAARRIAPLGIAGALILIGALLVLIPTGVTAKAYLASEVAGVDEVPGPNRPVTRPEDEPVGDSATADWHMRQLNYLLAIGAFLMLFAVSSARRIQLQARKDDQASHQK